jgi:parvulin-like peptidyl-prolyl isomerase
LTPSATATILSTPTLSETQKALVTETPTPTATSLFPEATITSETTNESDQKDVEETQVTVIPTPTEQEGKIDLLPATITPTPTITLSPTPYTTIEYGTNLENFEEYYAPYNFDLDDLRYIIEGELLREKLLEEITKDMDPIEEQVWARHILVETEEEALDILSKLEEGQDFGELAKEYSVDESNSEKGGDLGWFNRDTMVDEFTNVAFTLEVGEISEPIETEFGFHIIQNLGYRDHQKSASAFSSEKNTAFNDWLAELRDNLELEGEIIIYEGWKNYVPGTPEVPQQFLLTLLQLQ